MSLKGKRTTTLKFADRWYKLSGWLFVASLVLLFVPMCSSRQIYSGEFNLTEEDSAESEAFVLPKTLFGAVRIEARATLGNNQWATFQVSLLSEDRTSILEVVKESWAESGTWYEEGESGTWAEDDTDLEWDVRSHQEEKVTLDVSVLETTNSSGADMDFSVPIRVRVRAGVVDSRFLFLGCALTFCLFLLSYYVAHHGGKPVIVERNNDSEARGRASFGGANSLVALTVTSLSDENTPARVNVEISIRDGNGELLYEEQHPVAVSYRTDEGEVEDAKIALRLHFILPKVDNYGVTAEIIPDGPVEWTKLLVRDKASTRGAVQVIEVLPKLEKTTKPEPEAKS